MLPKEIIYNLISGITNTKITPDIYEISDPISIIGLYNTEVTITPRKGTGYYASSKFRYNRVNISILNNFNVQLGTATTLLDLLPQINNQLGFGVLVSLFNNNNIESLEFLNLQPYDIANINLPVSIADENTYVTLLISNSSYVFIGEKSIGIGNITNAG